MCTACKGENSGVNVTINKGADDKPQPKRVKLFKLLKSKLVLILYKMPAGLPFTSIIISFTVVVSNV
jgi:hypothetical protein